MAPLPCQVIVYRGWPRLGLGTKHRQAHCTRPRKECGNDFDTRSFL